MEIDSQWVVIGKVVFSIFLGGLIGLERELAGKPAGLRTHMLVAGASTLFVILGDIMIHQFSQTQILKTIQTDPIRIMEAVITGISFLGAGTIIFRNQESTVEGLTTAASILFISGIGMAVALSEYILAASLTVVVIGILFLLGLVQNWIVTKQSEKKQNNQK